MKKCRGMCGRVYGVCGGCGKVCWGVGEMRGAKLLNGCGGDGPRLTHTLSHTLHTSPCTSPRPNISTHISPLPQHTSPTPPYSPLTSPCTSLHPGLEIDNEVVKNNSMFDTSKKSREFLHSITKIKSREYRSIDNGKSILFPDSVNNDSVNIF